MAKTVYFLIFLLFLQHCRCQNEERDVKASSVNKSNSLRDTVQPNSSPSFLNGIRVKTSGPLVVSSAYLSNEAGNLLPPRNITKPGEAVYLNLVIHKGWTVNNGRIAPGASQVITTDKGESVVETGDLFAGTPAIPETKGKQLQLKTTITKSRPGIRYFTLHFRIWDKEGPGEAQGSYRIWLSAEQP